MFTRGIEVTFNRYGSSRPYFNNQFDDNAMFRIKLRVYRVVRQKLRIEFTFNH